MTRCAWCSCTDEKIIIGRISPSINLEECKTCKAVYDTSGNIIKQGRLSPESVAVRKMELV